MRTISTAMIALLNQIALLTGTIDATNRAHPQEIFLSNNYYTTCISVLTSNMIVMLLRVDNNFA